MTMNASIAMAIRLMAERITHDTKPTDALQLTQAALNLAHVAATLDNMKDKSGEAASQ